MSGPSAAAGAVWDVYEGNGVSVLPRMIEQGVVPWSMAALLLHRQMLRFRFGEISWHSSDLAAYGSAAAPDELKLILTVDNEGRLTKCGRRAMEIIAAAKMASGCGVVLTEKAYASLKGVNVITLPRTARSTGTGLLSESGLVTTRVLDEREVLAHRAWQVLLRHPDAVPAEYAIGKDQVHATVRELFEAMRVSQELGPGALVAGMQFCVEHLTKKDAQPVLHQWHLTTMCSGFNAMAGYPRVFRSRIGTDAKCRFIGDGVPDKPTPRTPSHGITVQTVVPEVTRYTVHEGGPIEVLPAMLSRGEVPLCVAELIRRKESLWRQFGEELSRYGSSDLFVHCGSDTDDIKIVLTVDNRGRVTADGRRVLDLIRTGREELCNGIALSAQEFASITGPNVFHIGRSDVLHESGTMFMKSPEWLSEDVCRLLNAAEFYAHPVWRVLLRHPTAVPSEYAYPLSWVRKVMQEAWDHAEFVTHTPYDYDHEEKDRRVRSVGFEVEQWSRSGPRLVGWALDLRSWDERLHLREFWMVSNDPERTDAYAHHAKTRFVCAGGEPRRHGISQFRGDRRPGVYEDPPLPLGRDGVLGILTVPLGIQAEADLLQYYTEYRRVAFLQYEAYRGSYVAVHVRKDKEQARWAHAVRRESKDRDLYDRFKKRGPDGPQFREPATGDLLMDDGQLTILRDQELIGDGACGLLLPDPADPLDAAHPYRATLRRLITGMDRSHAVRIGGQWVIFGWYSREVEPSNEEED